MSDPEPEQSSRTAEDASTEHSGFASHYDETGQHVISDVQPGSPSSRFSIAAARDNFIVTVDGSGYKIIHEGHRLIIENTLVDQEVVTNGLAQDGEGAGHDHYELNVSTTQTEEISPNVEDAQSQAEVTPETHLRPEDGEEDMWQWLHALDTTQNGSGQSRIPLDQSPFGPAPTQPTITTSISKPNFDFTINEVGGRRYLRDELVALRSHASTRALDLSTCQAYHESLSTAVPAEINVAPSSTYHSSIKWTLSFPFTNPYIRHKSYLRTQTYPIDIREQQRPDGSFFIPRTLIIACTDPVIDVAHDKVAASLMRAAERQPISIMEATTSRIDSTTSHYADRVALDTFIDRTSHVMVCPPQFAKDLLTAGVKQVYWLNSNQRYRKDLNGLRVAFEDLMEEHPLEEDMEVTVVFEKDEKQMALRTRDWLKDIGARLVDDGRSVEEIYAGDADR